ncbi:hypothetical protein PHSY_004951 [Pseudozyma hubeiensis SY62]|uniref:Uncharacterized protein n=1 Tax=Pseudozyma hubeiensis (strain SY62) TaxID=1305764 RepID=R9P7P4_PSEHS|nr:hypothetical protein PHSY_004951 [Pseudozyma hubeiensis SY62]GAC97366.1 hypothetical protein PHSY_004951 [Pseudozyma hubeiensis SY62]
MVDQDVLEKLGRYREDHCRCQTHEVKEDEESCSSRRNFHTFTEARTKVGSCTIHHLAARNRPFTVRFARHLMLSQSRSNISFANVKAANIVHTIRTYEEVV